MVQQFIQNNFIKSILLKKIKKLLKSLHYNGANSYLFVNGTEIHKFKAKDFEIVAIPFCLENISKEFSVDNLRKKNRIKWICL